jgi:hypothetical protein
MLNVVHKIRIATGHGGRDKMIKEANKKYANVSIEALELFKELCEKCQLKKRKLASKCLVVNLLLAFFPDFQSDKVVHVHVNKN